MLETQKPHGTNGSPTWHKAGYASDRHPVRTKRIRVVARGAYTRSERSVPFSAFVRVRLRVTVVDAVPPIVLLTGEVPTQDLVATIGEIARTTAKVRRVHNEITVGPVTDVGSRTNDSYITSKVKARFVESNKFAATHVKVVTERQVVYLMGLVRRDEGDTAGQLASTTSGVLRVVKLFEYIG